MLCCAGLAELLFCLLQAPVAEDYQLVCATITPGTNLFFHLYRAWLGAHMRLALVDGAAPGGWVWVWLRVGRVSVCGGGEGH